MNESKILIAVEDFIHADEIAKQLLNHRWTENTSFKIISVVNPANLFASGFGANEEALPQALAYADSIVQMVAERTKDAFPNNHVEELVCQGEPTARILQEAEDWEATMIMIGSHGRNALARAFMGSVSSAILVQAHCAVLIVRPPRAEWLREHSEPVIPAAATRPR